MNENVEPSDSVESTQLWSSSSEALLEDNCNFEQWKSGMQKISRISDGISNEFRPRLWLTLAESSLRRKRLTLDMNSLDRKLASAEGKLQTQISFDLHRTGSAFINHDNRQSLKRLLLRFACWNRRIGYCQGLNILAAIILQVMNGSERDAFKVFVYLIEDVLPKDYFGSQLSGLSLDMAVFRHMFNIKLPRLALHLDRLQYESEYDQQLGAHLEPPLVNVFTMQWFITLFSNCFSQQTTLRIWDLILLDGNETLLRTALALWDYFSERIISMRSADEFYTGMAALSHEVLYFDPDQTELLISIICKMEPYPFPFLKQIREQYSHHSKADSSLSKFKKTLSQLFTKMSFVGKSSHQENDNDFEEQLVLATFCVDDNQHRISAKQQNNAGKKNYDKFLSNSYRPNAQTESSISALNQIIRHLHLNAFTHPNNENISNQSLSVLKRQYVKFKQRQKQAQSILHNLNAKNMKNSTNFATKNILIKNSRLCRRSNTITSFLSETITEATKIVRRDLSRFSSKQQQQPQRPQTVNTNRFKSSLLMSYHQDSAQNVASTQNQQKRSIRFTISSESSTSTELCDDCSMISDNSHDDTFLDGDCNQDDDRDNHKNNHEDDDDQDGDDDVDEDVQFYIDNIDKFPNRQLSYSLDDLYSLDVQSIHSEKASFFKAHEQCKQMSLDND